MNIFLPQTIQTQVELEELACVERQIISPSTSKSANGTKQDGLVGGYNLSHPTLKINWRTAMNLITYTTVEDFNKIPKQQDLPGTKLYSMIVPPEINLQSKKLKIKNGEIVDGRITNDALGAKKANTLTQLIWDEYGVDATEDFVDNTRWLNNNFNLWYGFSVGYGDIEEKPEIRKQIDNMFETITLRSQQLVTEIENNPDLMSKDALETELYNMMKTTNEEGNKLIAENLSEMNAFRIMQASGSKGSAENVGQMMGCLGLQAFEGKLMPMKYNFRTLPYFHQNDDTAYSRGLVRHSFHDGLDFVDLFYQTVNGRSGLIDTAVKSITPETMIYIMENGKVKCTAIGNWIDGKLDDRKNHNKIEHHETANMELLNLEKNTVYIPTCDDDGKTSWGEMTAITRHDPGNNLYEIKTYGGRNVIVAESKSLIVWNEKTNKFEMKHTPDIKVGEFVPTMMNLSQSPVVKDYIDMTEYFPKTEYLYGTDFHKAKDEITGINSVSSEWWEENFGKTFTLPHKNKKVALESLRGNIADNIKKGCIYTLYADNATISLPEKFNLDEENGIFIGLFLADGNVDIESGYIQITKEEKNVKEFAMKWFDKYGIKYQENVRKTERGTITDVRAFSKVLAKFLTKLVGHGAENKFVPNEAFTAPEDFIKGIINGYFSGDGCFYEGAIKVSSVSEKLITGISTLCNRLGIFGRVSKIHQKESNVTENIKPSYVYDIRGQWATKFLRNIKLINNEKSEKLINLKPSDNYNKFKEHNDVVLDQIIEINKLSSEKYPKLYDVTVPSTINFAIANGLVVRDTAETGYMQRKLIKAFEDIMIKYDGTVRNANNGIVQFVYGDSGADTISQFEYDINIMEMNNEQIEKEHGFTKEELKQYKFDNYDNKKLLDEMKQMRNSIFKNVRKAKLNYIAKIKTFMIPVNMARTVEYAQEIKSDKSDLTPDYIIEKLENLLSNNMMPLICMTKKEKENKNSFKYQDDLIHKTVLRAALYDALSPKKVIIDYSLDKNGFDGIINKLSKSFIKNIVEPGEMVGVIAATATGEPLTQMNLSSFHKAGVSRTNVSNLGVPRMREVFSVSKNPKAPEMKIYLNKEIRTKKEIYHKIKSNLKHTLFNEVRKRVTCYYEPNPTFNEGITKKDNIIPVHFTAKSSSKSSCQSEINHLPFLLRIEIDREKIAEKEIKLIDIVSQFCNWWELRYVDAKNIRKEERRVMNKITQLAVLCNRDNDPEQIIHIRFNARDFEKDKFDLNTISDFIQYTLDKFKLKGINDVTETYNFPEDKIIIFDEETGEMKTEKEWVIYTAGVNMKEIRYMNGIDLNKTISNDIVDTYNTFGIEIARSLLMSEISSAYFNAGGAVNAQHIEIIVDQMTMSGGITSIDRHGLNKSDADPLSRASFEKPVEQLWTAALFGEIDHMNGVSSRIMVGECIKGGTGYSELILNTDMIEKADYDETEYDKKYEEIKTESIVTDILNRGDEEDVFMPM